LYVGNLVGRAEGVKLLGNLSGSGRSRKGPYYFRLALEMLYYLQFAAREARADIHHGHYTPMLPLFSGRRAIVHFHGMGIHELIGYRRFKERYHAGRYVFCSRFVQGQFEAVYPDIPKDHLHVVHNGIATEIFRPPEKREKRARKNVIVYGGWIPIKGILEAVQAGALMNRMGCDYHLYVGGSADSHYSDFGWCDPAEYDRKVRKAAEGLNNVTFLGPLEYARLPGILRDMDVGLMPSTYEDPFPLVTLEMLASGLPVVAFGNGGVLEQIDEGKTGFLVAGNSVEGMAEKTALLVNNQGLLETMGLKARETVLERFTWERHCRGLEAVYSSIRRGAK
jgi:glycosyltransferase involved in cell wall biosynthesis